MAEIVNTNIKVVKEPTHEQLERKIAELREKMFALQKEIEGVESELVKAINNAFHCEYGETFYFISEMGDVFSLEFTNSKSQKNLITFGNAFKTKQAAEFTVERRKVLAEMRKFAFEPSHYTKVYFIGYNGNIFIDTRFYHDGSLEFETKQKAQDCIDAIGEERLKKYYFGVKDVG